ncbi:MAG: autotransporter outer membrane beta-barrel domain-containing protein, partial [Phascolarctobacterium sp.]|nr:autotransporter outer membrane beta-barrel domain-containing protein [Phascolarctobacterium sp.]
NDTKVTVGNVRVEGGTTLTAGDDMTLIQAGAMLTSNSASSASANNKILTGQKVTIYKGVAQTVEADVKQSDDKKRIYLEIAGSGSVTVEEDSETNPNSGGVPGSSELNPQVLVIGESRTAATAFTNQGSELIETGLDALARDNSKDTKVFAAVYGNHSEYATGSHVDVNGWSGIVGVGKTNDNGLTVGAFFENGEGNYSTHNVTDFGYLRGDGEAVYNGGGFLVRKDNASGVYTEASLRAGNLKNELRGAVIGSQGEMGYDIDTFYYGAHIGVGKIIARGADGDSLDVYGKFIYTHHDSENFKIDGDEFHFDSVDSERLRLGFRINEVQTNKLAMYYGAAWEYEFGGDADNTVVGYELSTPSLGGSTVIGEIGAHYKASEKWSIDLNGRAYVGQREGFSGSVQANYSF